MTMTIKEAITYFCKREYNALRLDCNKPIKYRDVSDKRLLEAHKVLIDNNIERVGSGLFKKGDKLIAKRIITFSERRAHLCYYPTKMTIKFMEAQGAMLKVLFSNHLFDFVLCANDSAEALQLIDLNEFRIIYETPYDYVNSKRDIETYIRIAIENDIKNNLTSAEDKGLIDMYLKRAKEYMQALKHSDWYKPKSDKKRTTKADVINYLKNYKKRLFSTWRIPINQVIEILEKINRRQKTI